MNIEKQIGKDLGMFYGAKEAGVNPEHVYKSIGAIDAHELSFRKRAHKTVMTAVHKLMTTEGNGHTKASRFVSAISNVEWDHDPFVEKASNLIYDTIHQSTNDFLRSCGSDVLSKTASAPLLASGSQGLLWLLGTFSALGGAGAGALTWKANRDIEEDRADNEAMKRKRDYYKKLTGDIQSKLNKNYDV